jgi:dTDP-4-amino-4,6-dideoxygalactose transaminase
VTSPYQVVRDFESAIAEYCGAPYAVTTTSCTMALLIACAWWKRILGKGTIDTIEIPRRTYISVPMSIKHAGFKVTFRDEDWCGEYRLFPLSLWDSARRLTSGMYRPGDMQCLSLHWSKILGVQQGGVIIHDDPEADKWLRRARFDGRTEGVAPKDDTFDMLGYHCYMAPETAAAALMRLSLLPPHNPDLSNDQYPDLSEIELFQ